jgi:hypothetical protein
MPIIRSLRGLLHLLTHQVPGVPPHVERPPGHQGRPRRRAGWHLTAGRLPGNRGWNHSPAHPPRVLVAWQRRVAAFFGQPLR